MAQRLCPLESVLSWHTKIIQVRVLPRGSKISYGGTYITKKTTKIAILPVGYWDGYDRGFGNHSSIVVGGKRCPVRGRVCMNLTMVDVSAVKNVKAGDKVTLIGGTKKNVVSADELAYIAGTINYEIVTRINPQVPRIVT